MAGNTPFIPVARPVFAGNEKKYLEACITSGWVSSKGSFIDAFEQRFAESIGTRYATTTSNGTTALHLALLSCGVGPGDQVIVPAFTFASSATTIIHAGAAPVFVDVRPDTLNIDETKIEAAITPKTKAIMPVHIYGYPATMGKIMEIAAKYNLKVIEDAAEAQLSRYQNQAVGSIGHIGCFSFFGNKIITTGEGGMCTTNNKELLDRMNLYKNHGMTPERRYWHTVVGYNYRMTNIQAALGLAQMEQIDAFRDGRMRTTALYNQLLADCAEITRPLPGNSLEQPVYWMYSILLPNETVRNNLAVHLAKDGVETRPVFPALITMPIFTSYLKPGDSFPVTMDIASRGLSLPTAADLGTEEINHIVASIKKFFSSSRV